MSNGKSNNMKSENGSLALATWRTLVILKEQFQWRHGRENMPVWAEERMEKLEI